VRVTNKMLSQTFLNNLTRNLNAMRKTQEQMSSFKKVSRPSDDPIAVTQILGMKTTLAEQAKHMQNMEEGIGWLEATDSALNNAGQVLKRAYELTVQAANGTNPEDSLRAIAKEIEQLSDELMQIANSSYAGRYIFGGTYTGKTPFELDVDGNIIYKGNDETLDWEIGAGVTMSVNLTGQDVFEVDEGIKQSEIFTVLSDLKNALESGGNVDDLLENINEKLDHILEQRAVVGAKSRRMEMSLDRAEVVNLGLIELTSKLEDIDVAETSMYYAMQRATYEAALMTGAQILQPTLLNFLR
jgi:flagellar hook-associated protein 3 FlgL